MDPIERQRGDRSFIATVLIIIGVAWMALTGLCTVAITLSDLFVPEALLIGALCMLPGVLIWLLGRWLRQRKRQAGEDRKDRRIP